MSRNPRTAEQSISGHSVPASQLGAANSGLRPSASGLLVSVRDGNEARAALAGGATFIDVKEPQRGSLGAPTARQLIEVGHAVEGRMPLSAACGELSQQNAGLLLEGPWMAALQGYELLKIGLAGCARIADWRKQWTDFASHLSGSTSVAAVVYADYCSADAPSPDDIVEAGARIGCPWLLVDTYDKSQGSLFHHLSERVIEQLMITARREKMRVALAGSLTFATLPRAIALEPDLIAVRGAACGGDRLGQVDRHKVARIVGML